MQKIIDSIKFLIYRVKITHELYGIYMNTISEAWGYSANFKDYFEDGYSPIDAVREEVSYWR